MWVQHNWEFSFKIVVITYSCWWKSLCDVYKTNRSALLDIKHEAIAECFKSDKARTASFLNGLKNKPLITLIREESLKIKLNNY